jgi:hypothetical protein
MTARSSDRKPRPGSLDSSSRSRYTLLGALGRHHRMARGSQHPSSKSTSHPYPADEQDHPFRALPRFISAGHTWDTEETADIWSHCRAISTESGGLERVCLWMRVFTVSGVEVPWEMMSHITGSDSTSLEAIVDLIHAVGSNNASIPAESYAELCCEVFGQFCSALDTAGDIPQKCIEHALQLILKAYGVLPDDVASLVPSSNAKIQGSLK